MWRYSLLSVRYWNIRSTRSVFRSMIMTVGLNVALQFTSYEILEHTNYTFCIQVYDDDSRPECGDTVYQL
jgi:hypothetical protein